MSKQLENLIKKYLMAVDAEAFAIDNDMEREEQRGIDAQFKFMDKIEEFSKAKIKCVCGKSKLPRVQTFFKMYIA